MEGNCILFGHDIKAQNVVGPNLMMNVLYSKYLNTLLQNNRVPL